MFTERCLFSTPFRLFPLPRSFQAKSFTCLPPATRHCTIFGSGALTRFLSVAPFHSSSLFCTLKSANPLPASHTKSGPRFTPAKSETRSFPFWNAASITAAPFTSSNSYTSFTSFILKFSDLLSIPPFPLQYLSADSQRDLLAAT